MEFSDWFVVPVSGVAYRHPFVAGADARLAALQDICCGFVEAVPLLPTIEFWCNDTAMLNGEPPNMLATKIIALVSGKQLRQFLHGTIVFVPSGNEPDLAAAQAVFDAISLTDEELDLLREIEAEELRRNKIREQSMRDMLE
jgi:hypothetical protein